MYYRVDIQDVIIDIYNNGGIIQLACSVDSEIEYQRFIGKIAMYYSILQKASYDSKLLIDFKIERINIFGSGSTISNGVGNQIYNIPTLTLTDAGWKFVKELIRYRESLKPKKTIEEQVEEFGDKDLWKLIRKLFSGIFHGMIRLLKFLRWSIVILVGSLTLFFAADSSPYGHQFIEKMSQNSYCKKLLELL